MKAVTVGGHLTPALAIMDHTNTHGLGVQWWFFGRLFTRSGQKSQEQSEAAARQATFIAFNSPKLAGRVWQWPWLIPQLLWSVLVAWVRLRAIRPDVVVVFGGYLAVPVVVAAKMLGIPVIAHEQTLIPGLASRAVARLANQLALTFPESAKYFQHHAVSVIGNAVRPAIRSQNPIAPSWYHNPKKLPILLVMGGSQGSQALNRLMAELGPQLLSDWYIVHQVGNPDGSIADATLKQVRALAGAHDSYVCTAWLAAEDMYWLFRQDARVVARSGANTVYELALTHTPAILVPLPISAMGEQQALANWLASLGGAIVLDQTTLTPNKLRLEIDRLDREYRLLQSHLLKVSLPIDATEKLFLLMRYVAKT